MPRRRRPAPARRTAGELADRTGWLLYAASWCACTALGLGALWCVRFPPMQDYPQHLFQAYAVATFGAPGFDWGAYYTAGPLWPLPYSAFYLLVTRLVPWLDVETAGRLVLSLAPLGLAAFAAVDVRGRCAPPWSLLLLIGLAFHPLWYLGFTNFLLSLPLLLFALRDQTALLDGDPHGVRPWVRHGLWLAALFLAHPYATLVFLVLATLRVALRFRATGAVPRAALAPAVLAVVFGAWLVATPSPSELPQTGTEAIRWWHPGSVLAWSVLLFAGPGPPGASDPGALTDRLSLAGWGGVAVAVGLSAWRARRDPWRPGGARSVSARDAAIAAAACAAGVAVLPFQVGPYTYFNLRLVPIAGLLLALALADLRVAPGLRGLLAASAVVLCLAPWSVHRAVDAERAELLPLLERMAPRASVLPLYVDGSSRALDPRGFHQHHVHDHYLYHLLGGGGVSPTLFPITATPLRYRDDVEVPFVSPADPVSVERAASYYRYVLMRGYEVGTAGRLDAAYRRVARSGAWTLYERRAAPPQG